MHIKVNMKQIGKRKNSIREVIFKVPNKIETVEDLISALVEVCVKEYNERKENSELLKTLSKEEIGEKSREGKISFGINYGESRASLEKAKESARLAFEDGICRIFMKEEELVKLEQRIEIKEDTVFTFVRMTMLSGRIGGY